MATDRHLEDRVQALEARLGSVEDLVNGTQRTLGNVVAEHTSYRTSHDSQHAIEAAGHEAEHRRIQKELDDFRRSASKAIEETYELLGLVGADVAKKAKAIAHQGERIERESQKISLQGWAISKIGLLVIVGAAVGGGAVQVALYHFAHRTEPTGVVKPAR